MGVCDDVNVKLAGDDALGGVVGDVLGVGEEEERREGCEEEERRHGDR